MDNRDKFKALLEVHNISQARSAELLCIQTQRPCSVRTVRSWLNEPSKPSSRPCPDWAVTVLEKALKEKTEMNELILQEIIDRIPTHKNIHKSDIVAYCDDNLAHAQVLYFPLGYLEFLQSKIKSSILRENIEMGFIAQLLEKKYGKPFDLSDNYTNWAECCKAFSCFLDDYNFSFEEKNCVDKLAMRYDFTLADAWFFLEALNYRPNSKIEVTEESREVINLYYDIQNEDLDGIYHLLGMYLGLEPII